jgi:uncharacterized membrane protein HdeD (DUF308 family)
VKKVYLPKWQGYFSTTIILIVWLVITYNEFFIKSDKKMTFFIYLALSALLLLILIFVWLMALGILPVYLLKEEKNHDKSQ